MEFGILFTSHPNHASEPYPHRDVHARVTAEIEAADRLGYDTAWVAEHHFSNQYGIMPDVFTYMGYLAARTSRIRLGTAVVTLPLYEPVRVVENMAFVDILSGGRVTIGLGSGYRPYEFEGFGRDFEARRDVQEEAIELILQLVHKRRAKHKGTYFTSSIDGDYEIFPVSAQQPHPPLFMAAGTDRSMAYAARHGFGLMLSTLPSADTLARQIGFYRRHLKEAPAPLNQNPAFGKVDIARWVYVAESDAQAKADTEAGIVKHIAHFMSGATSGYLGNVSEKDRVDTLNYDDLNANTLLHGAPETVVRKLRHFEQKTGMTSLLLHYPPYYGHDKAMKSLRLFAEKVMPEFRR
jgi:alkanesulfonate monooxygenase SsuD/methylene tetrahydromethanopterin reductase-like flavin-dependent oxidoreductase (luciferase family)